MNRDENATRRVGVASRVVPKVPKYSLTTVTMRRQTTQFAGGYKWSIIL